MKKLDIIILLFAFYNIKAQYTKIFDFDGINGEQPRSSLITDGNYLYGTTWLGGAGGSSYGTIFKIKPDGTLFTKLFDFNGFNGNSVFGSLLFDGTYLYGTAAGGGQTSVGLSGNTYPSGGGVLFKIKPDGTSFTKLFQFGEPANSILNGSMPLGSLISDGTYLYGMTQGGFASDGGAGVIFKIKPDGTSFTKLLDFDGINGSVPQGSLFFDGIYLYGATREGGAYGKGVIFKIKPDGTSFTKLFDFGGTNGVWPRFGALIFDGTYLYGTTNYGGASDQGIIYKIKTDGTSFIKLFDFGGTNGERPLNTLIYDGTYLYGMTTTGSAWGSGSVFKIKPNGTSFTKLLEFYTNFSYPLVLPNSDGNYTFSALVSDGSYLYGMTSTGGTSNKGIIFKLGLLTGINELEKTNLFSVFPNPSKEIFNIKTDKAITSIDVYNNIGILVSKPELKENNQIDLSSLSKGMYFLKIFAGKQYYTEKVIIE